MVDDAIEIRPLKQGEEARVCDLVLAVFDRFVAPEFSPEGREEFCRYVQPELLAERAQRDHAVLVAAAGERITGVIELRDGHHVSLFFVDEAYQGRGLGGRLFREALALGQAQAGAAGQISVNSSVYAVPIYERLGFAQTGSEETQNGIRFVPMARRLDSGMEESDPAPMASSPSTPKSRQR